MGSPNLSNHIQIKHDKMLISHFYFRAKLWKSMARPDKACGMEEDGKMRPGKLYQAWGNQTNRKA